MLLSIFKDVSDGNSRRVSKKQPLSRNQASVETKLSRGRAAEKYNMPFTRLVLLKELIPRSPENLEIEPSIYSPMSRNRRLLQELQIVVNQAGLFPSTRHT